jgi:hypothetical protein
MTIQLNCISYANIVAPSQPPPPIIIIIIIIIISNSILYFNVLTQLLHEPVTESAQGNTKIIIIIKSNYFSEHLSIKTNYQIHFQKSFILTEPRAGVLNPSPAAVICAACVYCFVLLLHSVRRGGHLT